MYNAGDVELGKTVRIPFNTFDSDGASVTVTDLVASDVRVYKDGHVDEFANVSAITVVINHDGDTGSHVVEIDTSVSSAVADFAEGSDYQVKLVGITVDTQTLNPFIGTFSIVNRAANLTHIGDNPIDDNTATLKLKQLDVQNSAGSAIIAKSTGSNGHGIEAAGNGSGEGVNALGGTSGHGIEATGGSTSGDGIKASGGNSGAGINGTGTNVNAGIRGTGNGAAPGIQGTGGSSGDGIAAAGGASGGNGINATSTDGDGISATGSNGKHGIHATGQGGGSGIEADGGATGDGINALGGASGGNGIEAGAQANNDNGMKLNKHGTGKDLDADEIAAISLVVPDAAGVAAGLHATTDGKIDDNKDILDKLDSMIIEESAGNEFTTQAMINAPAGGGGGDATEAKQDIIIAAIPTVAEIQAEIEEDGASVLDTLRDIVSHGTYGNAAIRTRGDAAWVTGGGGAISDILNVQDLIPNSIDLANTVTVRMALGLTNMVDNLPSAGEIDPGTITIDRKAMGATSWTNVVSAAACSEAGGIIYYDEVFDAGSGYAAGDSIRITFKDQKITVDANEFEITPSDGWTFQTYIRESMVGTDSAALASGVNVTQIDGNATNGNNATLNLKQLNVVNDGGHAIIAGSSSPGGDGINAYGNTTGNGMHLEGGATGHGISTQGGATSGHGIFAAGADGDSCGILARGEQTAGGTGAGFCVEGSPAGPGLKATGGSNSGAGIYANAQANDDAGMELVKHGTGKDLDADEIAAISLVVPDAAGVAAGLHATTDGLIGALNDLGAADVNAQCDQALSDYGANTVVPDAAGAAATLHGVTDGLIGALNDLGAADILAQCAAALVAIHLDHLLAVNFDPAAKPGVATALLNEMVESDGGVSRLTANALEQAPSGAGLSGDQNDALILIRDIVNGDASIDTTATPWQLVVNESGTANEVLRKNLLDVNGINVGAITTVIGQVMEP